MKIKNKVFDFLNSGRKADRYRNENCKSDYMRFQRDGFCQNCQQKAEFVFREKPTPIERLRFFKSPTQQRGNSAATRLEQRKAAFGKNAAIQKENTELI